MFRASLLSWAFLLGSALGLFLQLGCSVGPNYQQPEVQVPARLVEKFNGDAGASLSEWWKKFEDPLLNELVDRAIESNKTIQISRMRVDAIRSDRQRAVLELTPSIKASTSYDESRLSDVRGAGMPGEFLKREVYNVGFEIAWQLDIFGKLRRDVEAADANEESIIFDHQDALRVVVSELIREYFTLRGVQLRLRVVKDDIEAERKLVNLLDSQARAGLIKKLEFARAKAQLSGTVAGLAPLEAEERANKYRINVLCGSLPEDANLALEIKSDITFKQIAIPLIDPTMLIRNRPDVRSAERRIAVASARIGSEIADYFPSLDFTGTLGIEADSPHDFSRSRGRAYDFMPRLSWSALDLGREYLDVMGAKAEYEIAKLQYEQSVLEALTEVETNLGRFRAESARLVALREANAASSDAYELALAQYKAGDIEFINVLDARREKLSFDEQLVQSRTQQIINLVAVLKSLGWEQIESPGQAISR